ncbi:MAG: hypothetical protein IJ711_08510 [Lachnospiraceae bacterium]|nr:hypothetical protein [Lachnospiraceae bacterium]
MKREYRQIITDEYKSKRYPNGFFAYLEAKNSSIGAKIGAYILLILLGFVMNVGFWIAALLFLSTLVTAGIVSLIIGIGWLVLMILLFRLLLKRSSRTREDWIKYAAENSECPESDIREFDEQFQSSDCYFLTLTGKAKKDMNYILTDDYILVGTNAMMVVYPIRNILGAGFTNSTDVYSIGNKVHYSNNLAVGFFTKNKWYSTDCRSDLGKDFLTMLKEKNPNIEIWDQGQMKEKEFDAWMKELRSNS